MTWKILIADDDLTTNEVLKILLEDKGFSVVSVFDGLVALEKIREDKPDLVILDIIMPGLNGYQVCEFIKSDPATSAIPVIMLTANDLRNDIEMAYRKKADWYLVKPYDHKLLQKKILEFLEPTPA